MNYAKLYSSWRGRLQLAETERAKNPLLDDPWLDVIRQIHGSVGPDGAERITTAQVMDALQVPPHRRHQDTYSRAGALMQACGWQPVRIPGQSSSVDTRLRGWARRAEQGRS
jgi:hypothetical protein